MSDAADEAARKLEGQLRWYQREKLACRLKLYCSAQLVTLLTASYREGWTDGCMPPCLSQLCSFWFAFGPHGWRSYSFGTISGLTAAHGFHVANTCHRRNLQLVSLLQGRRDQHLPSQCGLLCAALRLHGRHLDMCGGSAEVCSRSGALATRTACGELSLASNIRAPHICANDPSGESRAVI